MCMAWHCFGWVFFTIFYTIYAMSVLIFYNTQLCYLSTEIASGLHGKKLCLDTATLRYMRFTLNTYTLSLRSLQSSAIFTVPIHQINLVSSNHIFLSKASSDTRPLQYLHSFSLPSSIFSNIHSRNSPIASSLFTSYFSFQGIPRRETASIPTLFLPTLFDLQQHSQSQSANYLQSLHIILFFYKHPATQDFHHRTYH